jgi:hypothetical protein
MLYQSFFCIFAILCLEAVAAENVADATVVTEQAA